MIIYQGFHVMVIERREMVILTKIFLFNVFCRRKSYENLFGMQNVYMITRRHT